MHETLCKVSGLVGYMWHDTYRKLAVYEYKKSGVICKGCYVVKPRSRVGADIVVLPKNTKKFDPKNMKETHFARG